MKDFNMKNDVLYENLVMAIREKYPERGTLTNMLADLLMIEKEAVYRRLRGDVPFTIFEIAAIANKLDISLDHIIGCSLKKSRPFQMKMVNFLHPREEDYRMLEHFLDGLRYLRDDPNSEVGDALNILPQSIVLGYRNIYRFYLFKWMYQCGDPVPVKYSEITPPDRLLMINHEIVMEVRQAANAYHIIDNMTFRYLVNDIKYFASIYLITDEEIELLKRELHKFLDDMEVLAARGCWEEGKNVHFFVSSINFETSYSYVETRNSHVTMLKSFTLNDATSCDEEIFQRMKKWLQSLIRTSTLISKSGEKDRIMFFEQQRKIVDTL